MTRASLGAAFLEEKAQRLTGFYQGPVQAPARWTARRAGTAGAVDALLWARWTFILRWVY